MKTKIIILTFFLLPSITFAEGFSFTSTLSRILESAFFGKSPKQEILDNPKFLPVSISNWIDPVKLSKEESDLIQITPEDWEKAKENITDEDGKFDPFKCLDDPICSSY